MKKIKLLELTEALLIAAENQDWERMQHIQTEREVELHKLSQMNFSNIADKKEQEALAQQIFDSQQIEQQCLALTMAAKEECAAKLQSAHKGQQMAKAYNQNR